MTHRRTPHHCTVNGCETGEHCGLGIGYDARSPKDVKAQEAFDQRRREEAEAKVEKVFAMAEARNPTLVVEKDGRYRARDAEEKRAVTNLATRIVVGMAEKGQIDPDNDDEIQAAMRRAVPMAFTAYRAAIDYIFG